MRFEILLLIPITALVGCGEPTYEDCVRDAVEDGGSEYGIKVLEDLCDRAEREKLRESASGEATAADAAAPADAAAVDPFALPADTAAEPTEADPTLSGTAMDQILDEIEKNQ